MHKSMTLVGQIEAGMQYLELNSWNPETAKLFGAAAKINTRSAAIRKLFSDHPEEIYTSWEILDELRAQGFTSENNKIVKLLSEMALDLKITKTGSGKTVSWGFRGGRVSTGSMLDGKPQMPCSARGRTPRIYG